MRKERINEIWGVFFLLLGLFTAASLAFFQPNDLSFYSSHPARPTLNHTGFIGAYLAHGLTLSFGLASHLIPLLMLVWSWCFFIQRVPERKIFKFIGLALALIAASVFLGISFYEGKRFLRAGAVGYVFGTELLNYFGPVGSYIITVSCFLLSILLATDFLIYPLVQSIWTGLTNFIHQSLGVFQSLGGKAAELKEKFSKPCETSQPPHREPPRYKSYVPETPVVKGATADKPERVKESLKGISAASEIKIKEKEVKESKERTEPIKLDLEEPRVIQQILVTEIKKEKQPEPVYTPPMTSLPVTSDYQLPALDLLRKPERVTIQEGDLRQNSRIVEETLADFGIEARVVEVEQGPVITRYELLPAAGVKVNRIISLGDDLALALKATSLRFIAPIPGKSAIGIEVPNIKTAAVYLRELLEAEEFRNPTLELPLVIGKDTSGKPLVADLTQMPHLLIAGTTGSGKTVCVNSIIAGLLYHSKPDRLKFVMVDPKRVELAIYNTIPHMLAPVVTDSKKAAATLGWVVSEMENRYRLFATRGVRNIQGFNAQSEERLPHIVVVIDELADLMIIAQDKVEAAITRLAQLSRAVGIHLLLATQRPSVDVITGVIKANFPARISFKVASKVDSRTVLDLNGADKLLGKGDLLFLQPGESKLIRGQGSFVVDEEIARVVEFVSRQAAPEFHPEINFLEEKATPSEQDKDELFDEAVRIVLETGVASASTLQRRLRLGYTRAARIIDQMEMERIVGPHNGSKPREILVDRAQALR